MSSQCDLANFCQFIVDRLAEGDLHLSPEEALTQWRAEQLKTDDFDATVAALRKAFAAVDAGDKGRSVDEFDREFRERRGIR